MANVNRAIDSLHKEREYNHICVFADTCSGAQNKATFESECVNAMEQYGVPGMSNCGQNYRNQMRKYLQ